jgi:hypothetical protein
MANKGTHAAVGATCGCGLAYYRSEGHSPADQFLASIGGLLGGWAGARFPDLIDVPLSPNHRSHAHSVVGGVGITAKAKELLLSWENDLRRHLQDVRARKTNAATDWDRMCLSVTEILLQIGIGVLSGLIAGHISHLALDAFTPKGLPFA